MRVHRPPLTLRKTERHTRTHTRQAGPTLQAPFSSILAEVGITDPFIKNWLSLLCFLLQGMPPEGTMTAVMAYMLVRMYIDPMCMMIRTRIDP